MEKCRGFWQSIEAWEGGKALTQVVISPVDIGVIVLEWAEWAILASPRTGAASGRETGVYSALPWKAKMEARASAWSCGSGIGGVGGARAAVVIVARGRGAATSEVGSWAIAASRLGWLEGWDGVWEGSGKIKGVKGG